MTFHSQRSYVPGAARPRRHVFSRRGIGVLAVERARLAAFVDGRREIPIYRGQPPVRGAAARHGADGYGSAGHGVGPAGTEPSAGWTPYVRQLHLRAFAVSERFASDLLDHGPLLRRLYLLAEDVVREYDSKRGLTEATRGRFGHLLTERRAVVGGRAAELEAYFHDTNRLAAQYWGTLCRRHPGLRGRGGAVLAPPSVVPPAVWATPDRAFLLGGGPAGPDQVTALAGRALRRALEIVGAQGRDGFTESEEM